MASYLLKLGVLLPAMAALIWGSLRLTRRMSAAGFNSGRRSVRLVETLPLAPGVKLAVIAFHNREVLVGCARSGLTRLAEAPARETPDGQAMVTGTAAARMPEERP